MGWVTRYVRVEDDVAPPEVEDCQNGGKKVKLALSELLERDNAIAGLWASSL